MDAVIGHKNGWAITNEADMLALVDTTDINKPKKKRIIKGVGWFEAKGKVREGMLVECAVSDKKRAFEGRITDISYDFIEVTVEKEIDYNNTLNKIRRTK